MARLTTLQKTQLNNMNVSSQRAGGLGTRLDALEFGTVAAPSAGTLAGAPMLKYSVAPALGTATATHAAITLTAAPQTITTGITNPDYPRIVTVKGNDANVTGNVVINGTDINGAVIADTIALNGVTEVLGAKAFKTVTSIVVPVFAVAGTETVSVGRGDKVGFPVIVANAGQVLIKTFDNAADAGTVTASATLSEGLYAPAGTFDGAKILSLYLVA